MIDSLESTDFFQTMTPGQAKRAGRKVDLRHDWETIKLGVMETLLTEKFKKGTELGNKLKATGAEELIEGNTWKDVYWGVCNGKGANHLGRILMRVRQKL